MGKNKNAAAKTEEKETTKELLAEVKKEQKKEGAKILTFIRSFLYCVEFIAVIGIFITIGFLWSQPQFASQKLNEFLDEYKTHTPNEDNIKIQNSIDNLMVQVNHLTEQNGYFMNIKANSSVILGIVERIDNMEKKVLKLSTLSNEGALILSSAMMIKEAASIGQSFEYEAEVLKYLSQNQIEIADEVDAIYKLSSSNLPSNKAIVDKFNIAYDRIVEDMKPAELTEWKDRIIQKIKEYVTIQRTDMPTKEKGYDKLTELNKIKKLVDNQDFISAINELLLPANLPIFEDSNIQEWISQTKIKLKFYQDLSKISAYTLVLMKTDKMKSNIEE